MTRSTAKQIHAIYHPNGWGIKVQVHPGWQKSTQPREKLWRAAQPLFGKAEHVIHNKDGDIIERNSYGNDIYPPKG